VAWLDSRTSFSYPLQAALHTLEIILGFHASDARNAAWTELPLRGADRDREVQSG
jgi:hypothetical protein